MATAADTMAPTDARGSLNGTLSPPDEHNSRRLELHLDYKLDEPADLDYFRAWVLGTVDSLCDELDARKTEIFEDD